MSTIKKKRSFISNHLSYLRRFHRKLISLYLSTEYRVLNWKHLVSHAFPHRKESLEVRSTREIAISPIITECRYKRGRKKEKRIWDKESKLKEKSGRTSSRGQETQLPPDIRKRIGIILIWMLYWKRYGCTRESSIIGMYQEDDC